jgi:hypothetical protein
MFSVNGIFHVVPLCSAMIALCKVNVCINVSYNGSSIPEATVPRSSRLLPLVSTKKNARTGTKRALKTPRMT